MSMAKQNWKIEDKERRLLITKAQQKIKEVCRSIVLGGLFKLPHCAKQQSFCLNGKEITSLLCKKLDTVC